MNIRHFELTIQDLEKTKYEIYYDCPIPSGNHNKHHLYPQIKWHELTEE